MDKNRFDELTRGFAASRSRRGVLKALGAAALAAAGFGRDAEAAPCAKIGQACGTKAACCKGSSCTGGVCVCTPNCGSNTCGPDGCGGSCGAECPVGTSCCGGACADLRADPANCGACGHACKSGQTCTNGACVAPVRCKKASQCPPAPVCQAAVCSGGVCGTAPDPSQNGASCGGGLVCQNGACVPPTQCVPKTCADLSPACGMVDDGCGNLINCSTCPSGQTCVNGECQTPAACSCKPGGGCCLPTDLSGTCQSGISPAACGFSGTCQVCGNGQDCCNGGCLDIQSDPNNCGACAHVCGSGSCVNGACVCTSDGNCGQNEACCGGVCVNIANDAANCGGCGATCPTNEMCQGGSCVCGMQGACAAGDVCCMPPGNPNASVCANLQTDAANCGSCGHNCFAGAICQSGACVGCVANGTACAPNAPCCSGFCDSTNTCAPPPCMPLTSCPSGATCGSISDGCGGTISCGTCPDGQCLNCAGNTCVLNCPSGQSCVGGSCSSGPSTCTPATVSTACPAQGIQCGMISDGCDGVLTCGTCQPGQTCVSGHCAGSSCSPAGQPCVNPTACCSTMCDPTGMCM